jgi:erythromycin esterase
MHFGGFDTGKSANPKEFAAYAGTVKDISIPEDAKIIALGEATHGNAEFQQLKIDVFKLIVEKYGVRAFALEGDYGGCEQVNRYIHGGEGTAREAAAAIGFAIYRTAEMENLISFMRQYNENAAEGEDLRFYGFDMQRYVYSFNFLTEACKELGLDTLDLEKLMDGGNWSGKYDYPARIEIITHVRTELEGKENSVKAIHFADMLLQYCELQGVSDADNGGTLRDRIMAENTKWIAEQEREAGCERIFVTGHNGHVARWGSYDSMGKLLAKEMGESYYVIGTDFYKTCCNMPSRSSGRRTNLVFYSHDPLAKAAKTAGLDICWLDFAKASKSPELAKLISQYIYMGNLGEGYAWFMRLLPPSYRIFQQPAELYDGMIFVAEASPTTIIS